MSRPRFDRIKTGLAVLRRSLGISLDLPLRVRYHGVSFRDRFCADLRCVPAEFEAEVFCRCVRVSGRAFAWGLGGRVHRVFAADLRLIHRVGDAVNLEEVSTAIDDHWDDPKNRGVLRRVFGARISTQRLRLIAGHYVPVGKGNRLGSSEKSFARNLILR
jgi:hypothetical protein